jgi:threonine dehydrogenase-like Zn-dependent dehydrogenase
MLPVMTSLYYADWERLEVRELPPPSVSDDEVLLKVAACGICGSELETFKKRSPRRAPPIVMGHEFCGTIADAGGTADFSTGQRVISNSIVTCGTCPTCLRGNTHLCERRMVFGMHRPGAFAEFVNVPASCLIPWPDHLSSQAACLAEPLANGVHVVNRVRHHHPRIAVVIGAGPIGLMCQQALQVMLGVKVIVSDIATERLTTAQRLGAHAVASAGRGELEPIASEASGGEGVDLVVDAVGSKTTKRQSLNLVRPGGAVVWIGLHEDTVEFDSYAITLAEKTVYGSYAAGLDELRQAVELMEQRSVDVESWVQTFPLREGVTAFQRMLEAKGSDIKGVLVNE